MLTEGLPRDAETAVPCSVVLRAAGLPRQLCGELCGEPVGRAGLPGDAACLLRPAVHVVVPRLDAPVHARAVLADSAEVELRRQLVGGVLLERPERFSENRRGLHPCPCTFPL